jgi:hypothetical protein
MPAANIPLPPHIKRNFARTLLQIAVHNNRPQKHYYEKDLFYWESRREWSKYLIDMQKWKKKKKGKRPKPPKASSGSGFYYENTDDWHRFVQAKEKQRYKPRHGSHHTHLFHDQVHDNVDIHVFQHTMEAYIHRDATKENVKYLAHVIIQEKGRLFVHHKNGKMSHLMDIRGDESEAEIAAQFPKKKPYSLVLRLKKNAKHRLSFIGGTLWRSPEYKAALHRKLRR